MMVSHIYKAGITTIVAGLLLIGIGVGAAAQHGASDSDSKSPAAVDAEKKFLSEDCSIILETSHPLGPVFGSYPTSLGIMAVCIEIPMPFQRP